MLGWALSLVTATADIVIYPSCEVAPPTTCASSLSKMVSSGRDYFKRQRNFTRW